MKAVLFLLIVASAAAKSGNMNGKYAVSSGGDIGVAFNDDYKSKGYEYFDVWAPEIATHYGEVFWTDQGLTPIPPEIVKRFDNKVIAIVGYEQDQVMVQPVGQPGAHPENDVSVPINWAYNHHYCAYMVSKHAEMKRMPTPANAYGSGAHGLETMMMAVDKPDQSGRLFSGVAQNQWFISEGNGGESRKSYHGYPKGYAQLIESPQNWHINPMQIDTRNREHGVGPESVHNCTDMSVCAGYEPRQARYGRNWGGKTSINKKPDHYSGILECPCNGRYGGDPIFYPTQETKILTSAFTAIPSGSCPTGQSFKAAADCFDAVATLHFDDTAVVNKTVSDKSTPAGCVLLRQADGSAAAVFNTAGAGTCTQTTTKIARATSAVTKVTVGIALATTGKATMARGPKGEFCADNKVAVLKEFQAKTKAAADAQAALAECEAFCIATDACGACSVDSAGSTGLQWAAIPECGGTKRLSWGGSIPGDISMKTVTGVATITLAGPAGAWFGVGLDASAMSNMPYTIVVNSTGVSERKLGTCGTEADHCPGTLLAPSVKLVSNSVVGGVRTVVVTRPFAGATKDYYTFQPRAIAAIEYIAAVGGSQAFGYHAAHDSLTLSFSSPTGPTCICDTGKGGKLCENGGKNCNTFKKNCVARSPTLGAKGEASGDLLAEDNPTCTSGQYGGGLSCCTHKRIMLDADQVVPDALLRYHMKFRFWFEEFVPAAGNSSASHIDLPRIYWQTEANAGEYDIPPAFYKNGDSKIVGYPDLGPFPELTPGSTCTGNCPDGNDCECTHTITYNNTVSNMRLIYAGGHCHAPSCLGMWLYRNDPGHEMELLCHMQPYYGNGTGTNSESGMYDEKGYLALPPCLWGDDPGLHPSVLLPPNTQLVSIKKNRNTHIGHFGEMASWQMRGVNF